MKQMHKKTKVGLKAAANNLKKFYNTERRPDHFKISNKVYISTKDLSTGWPNKKLNYK